MNLNHKKAILSHILGDTPTFHQEELKKVKAPNGWKSNQNVPTVKVELTDAKQERLILLGYYGELKRKALLKAKKGMN